ncbi:hypothetical protein MMC34_002213 [Xylographa carneopallida]|nr:hypothetical protein [Xylographa carneopallida]
MSRFYVSAGLTPGLALTILTSEKFGGSDTSNSDDDTPLPYPKPLARSAFLTPDFSPTAFLSSLHNRHQTLEDLRSELRTRSHELNKELLDLVNDNYQDFLGLGGSLRGGEEKVEEVRVGLLGLKREIDTLKEKVEGKRKEVEGLLEERRAIAKEVRTGRALFDIDSRMEDLEERLMVGPNGAVNTAVDGDEGDFSASESDDDSDDDTPGAAIPLSRLRRRAQQFLYIKRLFAKIGSEHPFLIKQEERMMRIRQTILLDLSSALLEAGGQDKFSSKRALDILGIYRDMGESGDALTALRERR